MFFYINILYDISIVRDVNRLLQKYNKEGHGMQERDFVVIDVSDEVLENIEACGCGCNSGAGAGAGAKPED